MNLDSGQEQDNIQTEQGNIHIEQGDIHTKIGGIHSENKNLIQLLNSKQTSAQINQVNSAKNKSQHIVNTSTEVSQPSERSPGGGHLLASKDKTKDTNLLISEPGDAALNESTKKENIEAAENNINLIYSKKESISGLNDTNLLGTVSQDVNNVAKLTQVLSATLEQLIQTSDYKLNAKEKDNVLSNLSESDSETLGSSSSELAILRSPSRDSLNVGFESSPVATSPVHIKDRIPAKLFVEDRTKTPTRGDSKTANSNPNSEVPTPFDLGKHLQHHLNSTTFSSLQQKATTSSSSTTPSALHSSLLPQSSNSKQLVHRSSQFPTKPQPTKSTGKQSPVLTHSLIPQSNLPTSSLHFKLFQQTSDDQHPDHLNYDKFITSYSSQRLKSKGDAAKRSCGSSSKEFTDTLYNQEEDSIAGDLAPDSLDIEKDSLEIISEVDQSNKNSIDLKSAVDQTNKDNPDPQEESKEKQSQYLISNLPEERLVVGQTNNLTHISSPLQENTKSKRDFSYFGQAVQSKTSREDTYLSLKLEYWDIAPVNKQEKGLPAPLVDTDISKRALNSFNIPYHSPSSQTVNGEYIHGISHDGDTNNSSELIPIINTNKEEPTIQSTSTTNTWKEKAVFILKSNSSKSLQSRQSSAQASDRLSQYSQAQIGPATSITTATSATRNPDRVTTTANKIYVTSPTFSDDEDGMYRLVNSRLDGMDDDRPDTYRELDMAAIQSQENYGMSGGAKISFDKRVSYNDGGRYEDRDKGGNGVSSRRKSDNSEMMYNPYGMQMSGPNRSDLHKNTYPNDGVTPGPQQEKSYPPAHRSPHVQPLVSHPGDDVNSKHPDFRSDVETNNPQQGRIISHNPQFLQQPGSTSQPPQPNIPPHRQTRARGISLPTGPSYDPRDEEDLQRETSYQQGLRMRVEDGLKKVQEVEIPKVPLNQGQGESQNFARDSLDYYNDDATARAFVEAFRPDLYDSFDLQQPQNQFRNPPPLPQAYSSNPQQPGHSRLNNVNFDSEDYVDYEDIRHQRINPQVQQRFYKPQFDANQGNDVMDSDRYVDVNTTARSDYNNWQENTPRYPPLSHTNRNDHGSMQPGLQRLKKPVQEEPMEAVQPKPPKYDFVNNNKEDYGKPQPKSYTHIHEVTKEEKEKLNEIFIHPKPKPKPGILKKKGQDQGSHRGSENIDPNPLNDQGDEYREMSPAEQVWAQRSASLAKRFDHKNGRGKQKAGPGALQKYNSDSSLNQIRPQQLPPDRRAFLTEMPTPPSQESSLHNQVSLPMSPRHSDIQVLPVSSQIILDDGQRISVDVNLKLISPSHQYQPYQEPNPHQPPAYYGSPVRGRQYPAVTQYDDDSNYNNGLQALEYSPADYSKEDYSYVSPRERYSADEALRTLSESRTEMNPYGKIPPIPRSSDPGHPSSAPLPDQGGSYIDMYRKQKGKDNEKPWYRVYGLKDYRKMQKEVRLGTLGPDLDSDAIKERREKFQRQSEYAKLVMERNKNDLAHRKPPAFPRPKEENDILNRRKVAVEYAKSVPKPVARPQPNEYNNYELASEKSPIAKHHRQPGDMLGPGTIKHMTPSPRQPIKQKEMDVLDLDKLRQRYEEDKQNEALIRRNTSSSLPKGEKYY